MKNTRNKEYEVSLTLSDKVYKSAGSSVLECLEQLKPDTVKARGFLVAKNGNQVSKTVLRPIAIKRMMVNPVMREILDKRLSASFAIQQPQVAGRLNKSA